MHIRTSSFLVLLIASSAEADSFNWTVDTSTSVLTTTISATLGSTLSDSETNHVAGTVGGTLLLPSYTFGTIHVMTADLSYTTNPSFSLTQPFLGGVNIVGNGLGFAIPGPNNLGFPSPAPAAVDLAGAFSQTGNGAEGRGTLTYTGVGILGAGVGSGTIDLKDQSPLAIDFNGTITQSGNQLLLTLPVVLDQTSVQNGIPVRVQINGSVHATATTAANGWKADVDGSWNTQSNWVGNSGTPGAAGQSTFDTAVFGNFLGASHRSISISSPLTPRRILVDAGAAGQYRFTGSAITLTSNTNGAASISALSGEARFESQVALSATSTINAEAGGSVVLLQSGSAASSTLTKSGAGVLRLFAADLGVIHVAAGQVAFDGTSSNARVNSLEIDATGAVSVSDSLVIENQAGGVQRVNSYLAHSFGASAPGGILPTAAGRLGYGTKASMGTASFGSFALSNASIVVRRTLVGDADLDRDVDFDDLLAVAQHYEQLGYWFEGDFNYDAIVNFDDLLGLAQNYDLNLSLAEQSQLSHGFAADFALARTLVPEPTLCLLVPLAARRSRRRIS